MLHHPAGVNESLSSVAESLIAGFRLDLSTIAYLMLPAFFLWILHQFIQSRFLSILNSIYHYTLLCLISVLNVANMKMYHEWESLLNYTVFHYLAYPQEVFAFISFSELILLVFFCVGSAMILIYIFRKFVSNFLTVSKNLYSKIGLLLLFPPLLVIAARGGLQLVPLNESSAYYSDTAFYNHVAVNPVWYFIHSILETESTSNPFLFMEPSVAEMRMKNLFSKDTLSGDTILKSTKPNIIFIILESWSADIIESMGGEKNITPFFDSLRKEGLLFTEIFSPGSRTEHGLISILSGYPPPPHNSIITVPYKAEKLPNINDALIPDGYHASFYYGGEVEFVNMKSYLLNAHFNPIIDKNNFEKDQLNSKWGAHDQFVFEKQLLDLNRTPEPFLSVLLTLSSHEPFEVPMETPFEGKKESDKFRCAVYYTDYCLGQYFRKAKKEAWYQNTLFILVADHGHRLPKMTNLNLPQSKKIPLLFVGSALKENYHGKTIDKVGNQNDIASTLLNQLQKDVTGFPRSKDMLNPGSKEFAYYTNDNVLGWITPFQKFIYFYTSEKNRVVEDVRKEYVNDSLLLDAKAYLQTHYQEYLDY